MRHDLKKQRALDSVAEADPWAKIENISNKTVQVWGTFVATWKLQGRVGGDADYDDLTTGQTAPQIIVISAAVTDVKLVCTAHASGTINAVFAGFNTRTE